MFGQGCTLEGSPDGTEFSAAVPQAEGIRVAAPPSAGDAATGVAPAHWHDYTRRITVDVNKAARSVVSSVWFIAHTIPSEVTEDFSRWGPFTLFDEPVAWRLIIERAEDGGFRYRLDGRPRESTADSDFRLVVDGNGYGEDDVRHGDGRFIIDLDAANQLDPEKFESEDGGRVTFTHDLPPGLEEDEAAVPREIRVEFDPEGDAWASLISRANLDGGGELEVTGLVDTDSSSSALEDATVVSRWQADGAGRADVTLAAGDTPGGGALLTITECWGRDTSRIYYTDSRGIEPVFGDASACIQ